LIGTRTGNRILAVIHNFSVTVRFDTDESGPSHDLGGLSPASHHGVPASIPGKFVLDLWWINWHWERVFSNYFGVPLSLSFHRRFICHRRCIYPSVASVIQYHIYLTQIQTVSDFRTNTIFSIFKCYNYVTLTMISCSK